MTDEQFCGPRAGGAGFSLSRRRAPAAPVVFLMLLGWTLLVRGPSLNVAEGDAAFYDAVGYLWLHGQLPYRDAFDIKPPGIFALDALGQAIFGPGLVGLKAIAIVCDALTALTLWRIGRRLDAPGPGLFAALLFPALSIFAIVNTAYSALAALTTLAFDAALSPVSPARRAALAGLAIGAAFCVKQTAAFEAVALVALLAGGAEARGRRVKLVAAFAAGGGVAPLAFLAYFAANGASRDFLDATVWGAFARTHSPLENLTFLDGLARTPRMLSGIFPLLIGAAFAMLRRDRIFQTSRAPGLLFAWSAAALASLLAQRSVSMFYATPLIAPALLLSGFAVTRAPGRPGWIASATPLGLAVVAVCVSAANTADRNARPLSLRGEIRAATAIRAQNPAPSDKLFVVNHMMWLYSTAGLAPPTPYFSPLVTLCELLPGGGERLSEIMDTQPRFVAVGDTRWGSVCERHDRWGLLKSWIARDYRPIGAPDDAPGGYAIYERAKPSP